MQKQSETVQPNKNAQLRALVFGGILPVVLFSVVENYWGIVAGLVVGMLFGLGEIIYEKITLKKIQGMTLFANGMILGLGAVSLISQEGFWFKIQPAIMELVFGGLLLGSWAIKKPLFLEMAKKQKTLPTHAPPQILSLIERSFKGMTFRLGLFFMTHCAVATWAALRWSTEAWAWLKGAGLTGTLLVYGVVEMLVLRYRIAKCNKS